MRGGMHFSIKLMILGGLRFAKIKNGNALSKIIIRAESKVIITADKTDKLVFSILFTFLFC